MGTGSQCPRMAAGKGSGACIILPCPVHTGAGKGKEFLGFLNLCSISVYNFALSVMGPWERGLSTHPAYTARAQAKRRAWAMEQ